MSAEKRSELYISTQREEMLTRSILLARLWLSPGQGRGERVWKGWVTLCSVLNDYNKPLQKKVLFPNWKPACEPGLNLTLQYAATKHAVKKKKKVTRWNERVASQRWCFQSSHHFCIGDTSDAAASILFCFVWHAAWNTLPPFSCNLNWNDPYLCRRAKQRPTSAATPSQENHPYLAPNQAWLCH